MEKPVIVSCEELDLLPRVKAISRGREILFEVLYTLSRPSKLARLKASCLQYQYGSDIRERLEAEVLLAEMRQPYYGKWQDWIERQCIPDVAKLNVASRRCLDSSRMFQVSSALGKQRCA